MNEHKIEKAVELMIHTSHTHKMLLDSRLKDTGLYGTQHRILMHLACRCKLPSQKELADHLLITPAAVTGALKKLEADGYTEKMSGTDNRFNEIQITTKGRDVVEQSKEIFISTDKSLFCDFSDDELDMYIRCLEKLKTNIKNQQLNCVEESR